MLVDGDVILLLSHYRILIQYIFLSP